MKDLTAHYRSSENDRVLGKDETKTENERIIEAFKNEAHNQETPEPEPEPGPTPPGEDEDED